MDIIYDLGLMVHKSFYIRAERRFFKIHIRDVFRVRKYPILTPTRPNTGVFTLSCFISIEFLLSSTVSFLSPNSHMYYIYAILLHKSVCCPIHDNLIFFGSNQY